VLTGEMRKNDIAQFQDLYRKMHGGSLNGAEDILTRTSRKLPQSRKKQKKRSARRVRLTAVVLAEFFTGGWVRSMYTV